MTLVSGFHDYDGRKQIVGRKRHLLVDTLGLILGVEVTPASVSDSAGAKKTFSRLRRLL